MPDYVYISNATLPYLLAPAAAPVLYVAAVAAAASSSKQANLL
jgi:hypothetical protein